MTTPVTRRAAAAVLAAMLTLGIAGTSLADDDHDHDHSHDHGPAKASPTYTG